MLNTTVKIEGIEEIRKTLSELVSNVSGQLEIAVSKTAKRVRIECARQLKLSLNCPVKILKKAIVGGKYDKEKGQAWIYLRGGHPIPLKYFKARQTKKGGVSYAITKGNLQKLPTGFITPVKWKQNVFRRRGKNRGPVDLQSGPAPGDVYQSSGVVDVGLQTAREELPKQIQERIRFLTLKAQRKLKTS